MKRSYSTSTSGRNICMQQTSIFKIHSYFLRFPHKCLQFSWQIIEAISTDSIKASGEWKSANEEGRNFTYSERNAKVIQWTKRQAFGKIFFQRNWSSKKIRSTFKKARIHEASKDTTTFNGKVITNLLKVRGAAFDTKAHNLLKLLLRSCTVSLKRCRILRITIKEVTRWRTAKSRLQLTFGVAGGKFEQYIQYFHIFSPSSTTQPNL